MIEINWILIAAGLVAGLLSGSVGFGGGIILMPIITSIYGIEYAVPITAIAQILSNAARVIIGFRQIVWKKAAQFMLTALPFAVLGALGFGVADKALMTKSLSIVIIFFVLLKLSGRLKLPKSGATMLVGGGVTGFLNAFMGVSGPISNLVFLSLDLAPVAYIASEAITAASIHLVKIAIYSHLSLINMQVVLNGLYIGAAMVVATVFAMKVIGKVKSTIYQKIVAAAMIAMAIWMFLSV